MKIIISVVLVVLLYGAFGFSEEIFKDIILGGHFMIDRQGYIYTNFDENSIDKYSSDGKFLLKIGRKGSGPSDIKRLGSFGINPVDSILYVTEFYGGNKWISKFSTDGKYLGELNCEIDWKIFWGLSTIKFDKVGNVCLKIAKVSYRQCKDFEIEIEESAIQKFSPSGKKLKTIYKLIANSSAVKEKKGNFPIPFENFLNWTVYGDKVLINEGHSNFISVLSLEGNLERKIPLPFKREKVTGKDFDAWEKRMKESKEIRNRIAAGIVDLRYWKGRMPFPEYKPFTYWGMLVDSHGNLYIRQFTDRIWAKIDLSSGKNSIITFPNDDSLMYIWKEYFFFTNEDEDGELIIKKISEKELFKKK
jgi:hypothetical protein